MKEFCDSAQLEQACRKWENPLMYNTVAENSEEMAFKTCKSGFPKVLKWQSDFVQYFSMQQKKTNNLTKGTKKSKCRVMN